MLSDQISLDFAHVLVRHFARYLCRMRRFADQMGNAVILEKIPRRIISLVPSQSELLWDFGLREELVGVTKFCVHPPELRRSAVNVGGTKKLALEKIEALAPDLIIGNMEENDRDQVEWLQARYPVWMSDIRSVDDAVEMIRMVGEICGKASAGLEMADAVARTLDQTKNVLPPVTAAYFMWKDPYMLAANETFIHAMMSHLGLINVAAPMKRYPEVSDDALRELAPEFCLLSTEPFPFGEKDAAEIKKILPGANTMIVDGEMFSWYGSRLLKLPDFAMRLGKMIGK